jgi:hypothetical protein
MPNNSILPETVKNKYSREIEFVRKCARSGDIIISDHCNKQMSQRNIRLKDVYNSIKNGVILEIQTNERDTKILFQDCSNQPPYFFVAVAIKPSMGICVTAYLPDPNIWALGSDKQWRRK